jgi:hypothetical protein
MPLQEYKSMTVGPAITTITWYRGDPAKASGALLARWGEVG